MLRFGNFAELVLPPAATAVQNGRMITNNGRGRIVLISRRDCAEAAAVTLTTDGHAGRTYEISGSEALLDERPGRPVRRPERAAGEGPQPQRHRC